MARTRIGSQGAITTTGDGVGIEKDSANTGFAPWSTASGSLTAGATLTAGQAAGVNTISGSAALTIVLPTAAASVGSYMVFRTLSAHAHVITASQETAGTTPIASTTQHGSRITLPAVVGSSVALISDGANILIVGNSGTLTIAGA